jgi:hypothetical protein
LPRVSTRGNNGSKKIRTSVQYLHRWSDSGNYMDWRMKREFLMWLRQIGRKKLD